ncbi:hypothetical protein Celaphus_00000594, partial [Cervus elaphus hippelaphus]
MRAACPAAGPGEMKLPAPEEERRLNKFPKLIPAVHEPLGPAKGYKHAANCYIHAFLIVLAIVGRTLLHRLSDDCWEKRTAWIYGMGLCALFIISTDFTSSLVVTSPMDFTNLPVGFNFFCLGVVFFKSDGIIPFPHAIWHLFMAMAAAMHYYANWKYLYQSPTAF